MSKNKEKEVEMSLRQPHEGQLYKYTNMVKGWQYRWFVVDPRTGMLEYFMNEGEKRQRPRSSMHLAGAIIVPSEEDSYTFTVNAANGESFKLRAVDAKERQYWINRLRVVAEAHTQVIAESNPPLQREHRVLNPALSSVSTASINQLNVVPTQKILTCNLSILDAFSSVRDYLRRVECEHQRLVHSIENLPTSVNVSSMDADVLLLKATSQATLLCLEQCLAILQYQQQQPNKVQQIKMNSAASSPRLGYAGKPQSQMLLMEGRGGNDSTLSALSNQSFTGGNTTAMQSSLPANPADLGNDKEEDYIEDIEENRPVKVCGVEEYKSKMLGLLSQFKLGTELTRTTLPVFFCEHRSLLQILADAFRRPDLLMRVTEESNPEQRMINLVHWYLQSFQSCQLEVTNARKPFNPVLGETFNCIWKLKSDKTTDDIIVRFWAEQVSHNPPISAFYLECPQKGMKVHGQLAVKAKFMGMYVGATLNGDLVVELGEWNERYEMGYPSLYVRSILSEPWMEFGGKVNLSCEESKVSSSVVFHAKPFYGGKPHHVTAEVKTAQGNTVCKVSGDWTSCLEFSLTNGKSYSADLQSKAIQKHVRKLNWQSEKESQKLWYPVIQALYEDDIRTASERKKLIEERQRAEERQRMERNLEYKPAYFQRENEIWIFKKIISC